MGNIPQSAAVFKHCNPASLSRKIWDKLSRGHAQTPANIGAKTFSAPPRRTETFHASHRARRLSVCVCVARQYAGDAAATSPAVPKGAWLRPRPARQSRDCLRGRVHRQASLLRRLARLPAAASPARHVWSAPSFVWGGLCGSLGYRSRLRRKARHASAGDGAARLVGIPPVAPASAPAAPAASRRLRSLRLTPPHHRPAPHLRSTAGGMFRGQLVEPRQECAEHTAVAHASGASGDACAAQRTDGANSAQVEGRRRAGPERNPPPARGRRRPRRARTRREVFRPSAPRRIGGWMPCAGREADARWRSETPHRNAVRPCQPWRTTRP